MTTFVGRERELAELRSLLKDGKRLLTLVGIGGIGKTRLALELGFGARQLGFERVYLVELASLTNPGLVESAVLESIGGGTSRSPLHAAVERLRDESALLVLDCCEHVLEAAAAVCGEDAVTSVPILDEVQGLVDKSLLTVPRPTSRRMVPVGAARNRPQPA